MSQDLLNSAKLKFVVIDDHELVLDGTLNVLRRQYPEAEVFTAQAAQIAIEQVEQAKPDFVVMDISIPEKSGESAKADTGIQLLRTILKNYPNLNLMVQINLNQFFLSLTLNYKKKKVNDLLFQLLKILVNLLYLKFLIT